MAYDEQLAERIRALLAGEPVTLRGSVTLTDGA
jgi:hypothetical protein